MILGILSDSHGDAVRTERAFALLESHGARKFFHCGDICGEGVLDVMTGRDCTFVWGNCDRESALLTRYVKSIGLTPPKLPIRETHAGKTIAVYHGHEREFDTFLNNPDCDYMFHGHTHRMDDRCVGRCRIINPGALYRAAVHTVALLDVVSDELRMLDVDSARFLGRPSRAIKSSA